MLRQDPSAAALWIGFNVRASDRQHGFTPLHLGRATNAMLWLHAKSLVSQGRVRRDKRDSCRSTSPAGSSEQVPHALGIQRNRAWPRFGVDCSLALQDAGCADWLQTANEWQTSGRRCVVCDVCSEHAPWMDTICCCCCCSGGRARVAFPGANPVFLAVIVRIGRAQNRPGGWRAGDLAALGVVKPSREFADLRARVHRSTEAWLCLRARRVLRCAVCRGRHVDMRDISRSPVMVQKHNKNSAVGCCGLVQRAIAVQMQSIAKASCFLVCASGLRRQVGDDFCGF